MRRDLTTRSIILEMRDILQQDERIDMFVIARKHITPRRMLYRARIVLESCSYRNCNRPLTCASRSAAGNKQKTQHCWFRRRHAKSTELGMLIAHSCISKSFGVRHIVSSLSGAENVWVTGHPQITRSSAIVEGPRDASCQLKSCQLPRNSAETVRQVLNKWKF